MKLIFAVISDPDVKNVVTELNKGAFGVTRLASTGGFLKTGNTTLVIGTEDAKVDAAIKIIKQFSKTRRQMVDSNYAGRPQTITDTADPGNAPVYFEEQHTGSAQAVTVGGATIFVTDTEKML